MTCHLSPLSLHSHHDISPKSVGQRYTWNMASTYGDVFYALQRTFFHPLAAFVFLGAFLISQGCPLLKTGTPGLLPCMRDYSLSIQTKMALSCVVFAWILQSNRLMNRKALNPAGRMPCNWPTEVVAVSGGSGGLGKELVAKLEKLGAMVAIMDLVPPTYKTGTFHHLLG